MTAGTFRTGTLASLCASFVLPTACPVPTSTEYVWRWHAGSSGREMGLRGRGGWRRTGVRPTDDLGWRDCRLCVHDCEIDVPPVVCDYD